MQRKDGMTKPKHSKPPAAPLRPARENQENVVKQEQSKGEVRPDGPGDATAPVETPKD